MCRKRDNRTADRIPEAEICAAASAHSCQPTMMAESFIELYGPSILFEVLFYSMLKNY